MYSVLSETSLSRLYFCYRFLRYLRLASVVGSDEKTYITGQMYAEMKKTVCYKIDLCCGDQGVLEEAQCECGAGQGPSAHCKHVQTVLFALDKLYKEKVLCTELTCTQVYAKATGLL